MTLTATRKYVKTGPRYKGEVVVLEGVNEGDRVVTGGQLKLTSGGAVTIATKDTLAETTKANENSDRKE